VWESRNEDSEDRDGWSRRSRPAGRLCVGVQDSETVCPSRLVLLAPHARSHPSLPVLSYASSANSRQDCTVLVALPHCTSLRIVVDDTHLELAVTSRHGLRCLCCDSPTLLAASHSVRKARAVRFKQQKKVGTSFTTKCNTLYCGVMHALDLMTCAEGSPK
jgi:hypothetical protein